MKRSQAGFTLMEIMVATAIFAILSSIAIPTFFGWLPGYRLRSATSDIRSNMQKIKMMALKSNKECAIVFDAGNNRYQLISDKGPDGTFGTADDTVLKIIDLSQYGSGVKFTSGGVNYVNNQLVFRPNGMTTSLGDVTLTCKNGDLIQVKTPSLAGVIVSIEL